MGHEKGHREEYTVDGTCPAPRFHVGDAQSKAFSCAPPLQSLLAPRYRSAIYPAPRHRAIVSPPPARGSRGAVYRTPAARAWTEDRAAAGPAQKGGAGRHGDRHLIELIQAAADTGRENPGDPRHAASGFPRGNSTDGSPPDSTGTVQRHSPQVTAQAPRTCPGRRKGAARRPASGKLRPARPCVGEKVPSRGGRAQLQPAPQA